MNTALTVFLAFVRIAAGVSLLLSGIAKFAWLSAPALQPKLQAWLAAAPNVAVTKYLTFVMPQHPLLARLAVIGELTCGGLLVIGFLTPLAALIGFVIVLNFNFASGAMFKKEFVLGNSGCVYLLSYLVLFAGRAGQSLGLDGILARSMAKGAPPKR